MTKYQASIIIMYAKCNMNLSETAREMHFHRNSVVYHIEQIKKKTGLDARNFYDLITLVKKAKIITKE